jgi:antitoxin (DNA-binding transcriptional repressor) of toxin-antitoxin stability system
VAGIAKWSTEAKTHLSRLVDSAAAGEEIIIARAGKPVTPFRSTGSGTAGAARGVAARLGDHCQRLRCASPGRSAGGILRRHAAVIAESEVSLLLDTHVFRDLRRVWRRPTAR